ncbi:uncharacterized protein LOC135377629 [Ornithodoros turicata]|uniref:uncharacterized protein LOC135377629 n=1 Tax=Ornithodoros turicata TaxID=34597 RepID=UPI0031396B89
MAITSGTSSPSQTGSEGTNYKITGLLAILVFLVTIRTVTCQLAELPALGCRYERHTQTLQCSNTTLDKVLVSLRIFGTFLNQTLQPKHVDIRDSHVPQLPFFLSQFNQSLESFRLVRSATEYIFPDAFAELALTVLDLSENSLYSIPYAVGTLKSLQVLNLSSNAISLLRPGPVFMNLNQLKVLDLSNNLLGVDRHDVPDPKSLRGNKELLTRLAPNITVQEFSLEPVADNLHLLFLNGNHLATVPEQLYKRIFPRLLVLNLDDNILTNLPEFSSALLPELKNFTVKRNFLQLVPFYSLPVTAETADLRDNPIRCDCAALWLQEWNTQMPTGQGSLTLPPCASPEAFRGRSLSSITAEALCWHGNQTRLFRYIVRDFEKHALLALTSLDSSISVTWSVSNPGLQWVLLYRKESSSPYQMTPHPQAKEKPRTTADEAVFTDIITDLEPDTVYVVCAGIRQEPPRAPYIMDAKRCQKARTKVQIPPQVTTSVVSVHLQVTPPQPYTKKAKTILLSMKKSTQSVTLRWRVETMPKQYRRSVRARVTEDAALPKEWVILVRKFGSQNFTEIRISDSSGESRSNSTYSYTVPNLHASTAYDVCLIAMDSVLEDNVSSISGYAKHVPDHLISSKTDNQTMTCKEMLTEDEEQEVLIKTIAIVTTVSSTTTAVVVALLCCCCPSSTFRGCYRSIKSKLKPKTKTAQTISEKDNSYHSSDNSVKLLVPVHNPAYEDTEPIIMPRCQPSNTSMRPRSKSVPEEPLPEKTPQLLYSPWEDVSTLRKTPRRTKSEYRAEPTGYIKAKLAPTAPDIAYVSIEKNVSSSAESYVNHSKQFSWGHGYLNSSSIQYLDGRKVQVYSHGSKTLPKSCLKSAARKRQPKTDSFRNDKHPPEVNKCSTTPRRGSLGRSSQRLSFRTFGKGCRDNGTHKPARSLPPLPSRPPPAPPSAGTSAKQESGSGCEVFIEHV